MIATVLLGAGPLLFERLLPPVTPVQQVQNTPVLISALLTCFLAAVYFVLWRAAPDFRAFLSLGIFFAVVGVNTSTAGDVLAFLSDRVIEARNSVGELFGFDRAARISTQSAENIASASQQFGREDDITVLTLARTAAEALHA